MLNTTSKGLKVKQFNDYTDGNVEEKLNKFFQDNPNLSVIDIIYNNMNPSEGYEFCYEWCLLIYKELG